MYEGFIVGLFFGGIFAEKRAVIFAVAAGASALFGGLALLFVDDGPIQTSGSEPTRRISLLKFDWFGAALSALGLVGLSLGLTMAGTTDAGWNTPAVLSLSPIGVALLAGFFVWEWQSPRYQSSSSSAGTGSAPTGRSTTTTTTTTTTTANTDTSSRQHTLRGPLIPSSIWTAKGFSPALACVWFSWFAFNSLTYYSNLLFQEVQGLTPVQSSIRFLPMVGAGIIANVAGGLLMSRLKLVHLLLIGCLACAASCVIFSLQDITSSYAQGMLPVLILLVGPDIFFPGIQLFACNSVGSHRAALAGSLFNVTTRLATSIGLAFCALAQNAGTKRYAMEHSVSEHEREAVMAGYRAAGWLCFGTSMVAAGIAVVYLRKTAVNAGRERPSSDISLNELPPQSTNAELDEQPTDGDATSKART